MYGILLMLFAGVGEGAQNSLRRFGVEAMDRWLRRVLKSRWKGVITLLIVLALIISFIVYIGIMESEARREGEAWLRRHQYPSPGFWWDFSSASGFDLGYRGSERMLTLLRGGTGSIELVISTNACRKLCPKLNSCELSLYGTLDGSGSWAILPPGVKAEFTPTNFTLPAGGNVSVLQTITTNPDAPTGCYYYGVGIRITNGTGFVGFWLVIDPYTPHGDFSLVVGYGGDVEDFIARDELNITEKVGEEIWRPSGVTDNFGSGGTYSFDIRSEGPPLNVTLEIVNIDMPEEVKLSVPQQVFVPAESQVFVDVGIGYNANPVVGRTYHFKVICRSGNETHVANYNILVIP